MFKTQVYMDVKVWNLLVHKYLQVKPTLILTYLLYLLNLLTYLLN